MPFKTSILPRWKDSYDNIPRLQIARKLIDRASDTHDRIRAESVRLQEDKHLSALGRGDAMRKYATANVAPHMYRSRAALTSLRTGLDRWRARLEQVRAPDKTDAAGAILRGQIRDRLEKMKDGERLKLLAGPNADPLWVQAARESPRLAGLNDEALRIVIEAQIEREHPGVLAQIEEADEAFALAEASYKIARSTVRSALDLPDNDSVETFFSESLGEKAASIAAAGERDAGSMIA